MRARDFITEIDRRGFLKGFGAAAASAAIPGIAKAQTGKDVFRIDTKSKEFLDAAKMLKDYFKKNLKVSPNVSQYTHGMFKIRFNGQGKILSVDFESPLGNPALEKAVKDSIIDIPNNIITSFQLEPADTSFIKFSTKNYLPEPTTSGTTDKEPSAGDNEVTKVQKAVNI